MAKQLTLPNTIGKIFKIWIHAAFPWRCWHCEQMYFRVNSASEKRRDKLDGEEVAQWYGALMADYLCPACINLFKPVQSPQCSICGQPFTTQYGIDHECPDCLNHSFAFDAVKALGVFDHGLRTIIHHYKYQGRSELASALGGLLWVGLHSFYDINTFDIILPVPLHWYRQYRRGFNQAALLVRQWKKMGEKNGVGFNSNLFSEKVLFRLRHTPSQAGLGKKRRFGNLKDAFAIGRGEDVDGKRILLVDDVLTSGATVDACARVLKGAGAAKVFVLTVARTVESLSASRSIRMDRKLSV